MAARLVDFRRIDNIARQRAIDIYNAALIQEFDYEWKGIKPSLSRLKKADGDNDWLGYIARFTQNLNDAFLEAAKVTTSMHRDWWNDRGMSEGIVHDPGEITEALLDIIGKQQDFEGRTVKDYFENMAQDTRDQTAEKIAHWQMTDAGLDTLIEDLDGLFTPIRANRIAVTESTRLASAIMISNMTQLGYQTWTYYTASDEIVCPECSEKHGQKYKVDDLDDWPPIHVNCRCSGGVELEDNPL